MSKGRHHNNEPEIDSDYTERLIESEVFVNPFASGVTYDQIASALKGKTIREYLNGKEKSPGKLFDEHDIKWLEAELKIK